MTPPSRVTLLTHTEASDTGPSVRRAIADLRAAGVEVRVPTVEAEKHGLGAEHGVTVIEDPGAETDLALVFGGDGTILTSLRLFAGTSVPTFALNFGAIGFLATLDRHAVEEGIRRVLEGDFTTLAMPALAIETPSGTRRAASDISFHRRPEGRVAELSYSVEGVELGKVRCDGLVASTPVGSTGYNLANGGPLLAWGVEGFVVSFIAPHSLTARAVVVAPETPLSVCNRSDREGVDVTTDGRTVLDLGPGAEIEVRFEHDQVRLALVPGTGFYGRLQEKFGHIAY